MFARSAERTVRSSVTWNHSVQAARLIAHLRPAVSPVRVKRPVSGKGCCYVQRLSVMQPRDCVGFVLSVDVLMKAVEPSEWVWMCQSEEMRYCRLFVAGVLVRLSARIGMDCPRYAVSGD